MSYWGFTGYDLIHSWPESTFIYKLESVDCVLTATALRMHFWTAGVDCLFNNRLLELE